MQQFKLHLTSLSIDMKYLQLKNNHILCPLLCGGKLNKDSHSHIF